jgi:DNA-binding FadR family transcriptional regulator
MTGRLQRTSLVDQAIEALRAQIAAGAWPVGERIPTEPALVAELGIGRNSLREAIRALVHAGLLETRQGDGTYVRATSDLAGAVRRRTSRAELVEVFEVRRALEVEAARLAALRRTDGDLAELERVLAERAQAGDGGDLERFVESDVQLHRLIAAASQNAMLTELYDDFSAALRELLHASVGRRPLAEQLTIHDELIAAIRAGDADAAAATTAAVLDMLIADLSA